MVEASVRKSLLLFFSAVCFVTGIARAQTSTAWKKLRGNSRTVPIISPADPGPGRAVALLEIPFGQSLFSHPEKVKALAGLQIESIELVYTTYAESKTFLQDNLNLRRVEELHRLLPGAFSQTWTGWQLTGQTAATAADSARQLFHGFIITYRPAPDAVTVAGEIAFLEKYFSRKPGGTNVGDPGSDPGSTGTTVKDSSSGIETDSKLSVKDRMRYTALQVAIKRLDIRQGVTVDTSKAYVVTQNDDYAVVKLDYRFQNHKLTKYDTVLISEIDTAMKRMTRKPPPFADSIFKMVMRRNAHWENIVLICDVTGSMSPYTAQIFEWLSDPSTRKKIKQCFFFNDGDGKAERDKKNGSTGGIYGVRSSQFDSIFNTATLAMHKGDGGMTPENNIEAALYAIAHSQNDSLTDIIMIADNLSTPHDMALLKKINRPVHVIACGSRHGINPCYLKIARVTKGSVHTMNDDAGNLEYLENEQVIKIGKENFKIIGDDFFQTHD